MNDLPERLDLPAPRYQPFVALCGVVALWAATWFLPFMPHFADDLWFYPILTLVVAVWCWRSRTDPAGLWLDPRGFKVSNGWITGSYAWTAVSEFKIMYLPWHTWIEFRDKTQSDLDVAHYIRAGVMGRSLEDVCRTLNAFRQRVLESAA